MKARIVVNPISGGGRSMVMAERIGARLLAMGYEVSQYQTTRADSPKQRRKRRDPPSSLFPKACDLAVAIGGDGTINLALNCLPEGETPLMVVPAGTGNVLARELRIPWEPEALCRLVEAGSVVEVDTMLCGERRFLLMAGAGLDAEVARLVGLERRGRLSFLSYGAPLLRALRGYRPRPITVEVDGRIVTDSATLVIVTNVATYGGPMVIAPQADPCDGLFDVCIIRSRNPVRLLGLLAQAFAFRWLRRDRHRRLDKREVQYVTGKRMSLRSAARVPLQLDGDFFQYLPATVEIASRKVRIVAPTISS